MIHSHQVLRRPWRVLADLLALGLAPYVPRLYASRWLDGLSRPSVTPALPDADGPLAVALSHAHLDHSAAGRASSIPRVPLSTARAPRRASWRALAALGSSAGAARAVRLAAIDNARLMLVGPMRVELLPVDHDVCGAGGLLIHTSGGTIAYSGDLRLHGTAPQRSLPFARAARAAGARSADPGGHAALAARSSGPISRRGRGARESPRSGAAGGRDAAGPRRARSA